MSGLHMGYRALLASAVLTLAGCGELPGFQQKAKAEKPQSLAVESPSVLADERLRDIEEAVRQQNIGVARELATQAQNAFPNDPRVHLARARVEASLGNAGDSANAFGLALDHGLTDPSAVLADPAFDKVRNAQPFAEVRRRLSKGQSADGVGAPTSRLKAGEVEIEETADGTRIRAGDVVLDAND